KKHSITIPWPCLYFGRAESGIKRHTTWKLCCHGEGKQTVSVNGLCALQSLAHLQLTLLKSIQASTPTVPFRPTLTHTHTHTYSLTHSHTHTHTQKHTHTQTHRNTGTAPLPW